MADMNLAQDVGHLEGKLDSLEKSVEHLTTEVKQLTAALNQARGAKWAGFAFLGLISAGVSMLTYFGMRLTVGH